jgi:Ca2+-binding RTX toxin-like protein
MAPGSTLGTAQNIGTLTTFGINEALGTTSPIDFYKFSLTSTNSISLLLDGANQNYLYAEIYLDKNNNGLIDSGELLIASDADYFGTDTGNLNIDLGAGTYFVAVQRSSTAINSGYSLNLVATATPPSIPTNPGNTLGTAYVVGNLTGIRSFTEFVGNVDPLDLYKFSLTSTNDIQVLLSGVDQSYLNPVIYQDKNNNGLIDTGEQLYADYAGPTHNGLINTTLGAGTYYVSVEQNSTNINSNYTLQLSATAAPPSIAPDPGNILATAYNVGTLTGIRQFKEFVGTVDPIDFYKFSLTSTQDIKLLLSGVTQSYLDPYIYQDKNNNGVLDTGEQLYVDYAGSSRNGEINTTLGAGTYYVAIAQDTINVNSNYTLQLSATAAPPSIALDPGQTFGTAYNVGNLTGIQQFKEFVGNVDPLDYYKFSLTSTNNVKLLLSGVTQNYLDAGIYQDRNNNGVLEAGELIAEDYSGTSRNGEVNVTLGAGNYYVGVRQDTVNVNSNYSLLLSATAAPPSIPVDPGQTLGTAYNIGSLTGIKEFKEFVGNSDTLDYYKFSLAGNNSIKLSFTGVTQNYLDVDIYQDTNSNGLIDINERLYTDYAGVSRNGEINATLTAGTYYVGVRQDTPSSNSNYTLQLVNNTVPDPANTVTLAVAPGAVTEDGLGNLVYTFTRTGSAASAATVSYAIGGTALFNTDYTALGVTNFNGINGTITFAVGSNVATLVLDPTADAAIEANETVALTLTPGAGYTVGTPAAVTGTITNDDVLNLPGVSIAVQDITVVEGKDANALLTVSLSAVSNRPISINYTTAPVNGTAGLDYTPRTGTLVIAANSLTGTISIPILNDNLNEADESFIVTLSNPVNATIDPLAGIAEVTITDTLRSAITRTLTAGVENLTLTGAGAINGIGNAGANIITGNLASNQLNGAAGNDVLIGGAGADSFLFNGAILTGANTVATVLGRDGISDFVVATDKIALSKGTFSAITSAPGVMLSADFISVLNDTVALTGTQSAAIIYSQATGNLFYNQNGVAAGFGANGGNFAVLATHPVNLGATDFTIIA